MSFRYRLPGNYNWKEIDSVHPQVEPLCYPLLFPCGERGWGSDLKQCDFMSYLANRLLMPEQGLWAWNKDRSRHINVNRFQLFARLAQYFAVESVSRALDYRLRWHRENQSYIFGKLPQNICEDVEQPESRPIETTQDREICDNSNPSFLAGALNQNL